MSAHVPAIQYSPHHGEVPLSPRVSQRVVTAGRHDGGPRLALPTRPYAYIPPSRHARSLPCRSDSMRCASPRTCASRADRDVLERRRDGQGPHRPAGGRTACRPPPCCGGGRDALCVGAAATEVPSVTAATSPPPPSPSPPPPSHHRHLICPARSPRRPRPRLCRPRCPRRHLHHRRAGLTRSTAS